MENTSVTSGLDVSTYWKALFDHVMSVIYPECCLSNNSDQYKCVHQLTGSRDSFLTTLVLIHVNMHALLSSETIHSYFCLSGSPNITSLLPATLFCLPVQYPEKVDDTTSRYMQALFTASGLNFFDKSLGLVIPSRFVLLRDLWPKISPESSFALIKLLVDHFNYKSRFLSLDDKVPTVLSRDNYRLIPGCDSKRLAVLEQYFSYAEEVHLRHFPREEFSEFWKNVLTANFRSDRNFVLRLVFDGPGYVKTFHRNIEQLFNPHVAQYKGLKEIVILDLCDTKDCIELHDHPLLSKLALLIDNQERLKSLVVKGKFKATPQCDALLMAVVRTIDRLSIENVEICACDDGEISGDMLAEVMLKYLLSRTTSIRKFKLTLDKSYCKKLTYSKSQKSINTLHGQMKNPAEEQGKESLFLDVDKKSLVLDVPATSLLLSIYSTLPCPITLAKMEYHSRNPKDEFSCLPNLTATSVVLSFPSIANISKRTKMKFGSYRWTELDPTSQALILNDNIKHLTVKIIPQYDYEYLEFFSSLGSVMAKHAEIFQTLSSFTILYDSSFRNIVRNHMHAKSESYQVLCVSLVSLAQVVPLELNLQHDSCLCEYESILGRIWKERTPCNKFLKIFLPYEIKGWHDIAEEIVIKKDQ